jgi:DNA-binding MarR family transcriptional regulator
MGISGDLCEQVQMSEEDRLIYLLFSAQQLLRTHLKNALSLRGIQGTPAQAGILFLLKEKDGRSMSELSQALFSDNSTVTGLVARMEKSGLVKRAPSKTDRRISKIVITPKGEREIGKAEPLIREINQEIQAGFSPRQIEAFKRILGSFFEKFNNRSS